MSEIEPTPVIPTSGKPLDYVAAAEQTWRAFTRKPVELIVGMLIATLTSFLLITAGAAVFGMAHQALEAVRGREVKIGTALVGYRNFVDSLLAIVFFALAVLLGTVLCVVPGLAAAFFFYWTFMCMADDPSLGAVGSMKRSLAVAKANPGATFVTMLVNFVLSLVGGAVAVGFLVTGPLGFLFTAAVFDQALAAMPDEASDEPVVTPSPPTSPEALTEPDAPPDPQTPPPAAP